MACSCNNNTVATKTVVRAISDSEIPEGLQVIREGMTGEKVAKILKHNFEYLDKKFADNIEAYYQDINDKITAAQNDLIDMSNRLVLIADNEDTSSVAGTLKLADRSYGNLSGKGFKILRQRLYGVTTSACPCTEESCEIQSEVSTASEEVKNILLQDDFNESNTIYLVRYGFDLNGQTIVLPTGCELRFEGGSFKNGSIDLNYAKVTGIVGNLNEVFDCTVSNWMNGQINYFDGNLYYWNGIDWELVMNYVTHYEDISTFNNVIHDFQQRLEEIENKVNSVITLDDVQTAINKGCGVALTMPSENAGAISLPMKTLTLSEYDTITKVSGVTYNIIE